MFELIVRKYIKNYEDITDNDVREKYGVLCSILSIICNLIMTVFKMIFGYLTNSVAIIADGLNNLSDTGSNLATLFGFKLANKHPDSEHPYGHGRIEYIVGMIISFLILFVGFNSLSESINKFISKEEVTFSLTAIIVLIVSILMKLWMSYFNKKTGKLLDSTSLLAAGQDSLNDVMTTGATLVSMLLVLFSDLPFDAIIGAIVSLLVLKSGVEIFKSTMDPLLGMAPDKELVKEIENFTKSFDVVEGIHDLMMHDYGPSRRYMTLHVEVNSNADIMKVHDQIDNIEREILKKFNILTTIHMDPIDCDDKHTNELKKIVLKVVKDINPEYNIHDFRMVSGITHTNLIFDVLLPSNDTSEHEVVRNEIINRIKAINQNYYCVIEIEHSYV